MRDRAVCEHIRQCLDLLEPAGEKDIFREPEHTPLNGTPSSVFWLEPLVPTELICGIDGSP